MYIIHGTERVSGAMGAAPDGVLGGMLRRLEAALTAWRLRGVERRCMAELDDRMMADIGRIRQAPPLRALHLDREG